MQRFLFQTSFYLFSLVIFNVTFAQNSAVHKGIYSIYETVNYQTTLKQTIASSGFNESYNAEICSYPSIKLGYSITAWGNLGFTDWTVWGVDFGAGISYSKSRMNGFQDSINSITYPVFQNPVQNNQTFFNFYQTGNQCQIDDYGINLHFDIGTILYVGAEIDAGPSRIRFTDNRIQGQQVKSVGWFANTRLQGGLSIPLPFRVDSYFKLNCKVYGIFYGWSARYYKLDWTSDDKKMKNFSVLDTKGQPLGLGFSLTFLFNN